MIVLCFSSVSVTCGASSGIHSAAASSRFTSFSTQCFVFQVPLRYIPIIYASSPCKSQYRLVVRSVNSHFPKTIDAVQTDFFGLHCVYASGILISEFRPFVAPRLAYRPMCMHSLRISFSCHFLLRCQDCASVRLLQLRIDKLLVVFQRIIGDDTCIPVGKQKNHQENLFRLFHADA